MELAGYLNNEFVRWPIFMLIDGQPMGIQTLLRCRSSEINYVTGQLLITYSAFIKYLR
jgi:hypothetical protein